MSEETTTFCADCVGHHQSAEGGDWHHPTMTEQEFDLRLALILLEEMGNPVEWFYISFAREVEKGGFLGGLYIRASGPTWAIKLASAAGLNPGGEALVYGPLNAEVIEENVPYENRNRLLSKEEV
jgi:hypothetical protein